METFLKEQKGSTNHSFSHRGFLKSLTVQNVKDLLWEPLQKPLSDAAVIIRPV